MPKRGQKNVPLNDEDGTHRKGSSGTIKSESGITHLHSSKQASDISEPLTPTRRPSVSNSMKVKHISPPCGGVGGGSQGGSPQIRFPKLEEYAHFHYDLVEIPTLKLSICADDASGYKHNPELAEDSGMFLVTVTGSAPKSWLIRRSLDNFATLDKQLHRCIFDRRFSHLEDLTTAQLEVKSRQEVQAILQSYLSHFSELAGGMVNCGSVLSWMEMDNRGHRLVATDDSGINTPAIAAAHVVKRYNAQAADEISLQVGDMISVIDMPPAEDTIWWRGKRGFEVGFFPAECVEVIGDKVPSSVASRIPEPVATAAASRRPCENSGETTTTMTTTSTTATATITTTSSTPSSSTPSPSPSRSSTSTASSVGNFSVSSSSPDSPPTMMRKHGKLLSFLRTFFSHRPPRNQLKQSGIVKERVFGCDLGEHLLNSGHDVPLLLKSCTDIIEEYGIVHGIYRLSGITSNIQKLRLAFDEDRVPDLTEECYLQDIHSISSLLKMYFRELPNPLLTYQLYDKFADAVRDEDNKLLKIHDVVQQLPPPHYRTTEYLMRHLARVAAFGHETEMHSKNLAIVWAPNLLRSKELEAGGGAAALQGVGIQAVVTECLICYCDIIFSDKMPNYGSQEAGKGQKKPRPKSLAISTPTRLLSLEEARERAFTGHLAPKKFIEVGGGPKNLPSKYHTVIDLPGYRKKAPSSSKENKPASGSKKISAASAPGGGGGGGAGGGSGGGGGWKSIFSKPRAGSVKKTRKSSIQDSVSLGPATAKALTEEDVHNWKRHLRSAKSAESLFSLTNTPSSRSSIGSRTSQSHTDSATRNQQDTSSAKGSAKPFQLSHKRSLSSDASAVLQHRYTSHDASVHPQPIDIDDDERDGERQSFVRGDSTRKALHHRRVPSAPNTPRQDRKPHSKGENSGSDDMDISLDDFIYPKSESRGDVNIDAAIKSRLLQVAEKTRSAKSNEELASSPLKRSAKTPPKGRKKAKGAGQAHVGSSEDELSPTMARPSAKKVTRSSSDICGSIDVSPYDNDDHESRMRRFYSRFHDYAEILSDDELAAAGTPGSQGTMSVSSSGCNMQDVLDQIDTRLAMNAKLFPRQGIGDTSGYRVGDPPSSMGVGEPSRSKETVFSAGTGDQATITTTSPSATGRETEFSAGPQARGSSSLSRETEFPATFNTSPRDLSNQATVKQLLGLEDSQPSAAVGCGDSGQVARGSAEVPHRRTEISRAEAGGGRPTSSSAQLIHKAGGKSNTGVASSTRVERRHAEFHPSSKATVQDLQNLNELLDSLERDEGRPHSQNRTKSPPGTQGSPHSSAQSPRDSLHHQSPSHPNQNINRSPHHQPLQPRSCNSLESKISALDQAVYSHLGPPPSGAGRMSKCLSVPSDIARSLENVTESQDMLSSVTISELSMSMSSFTNGVGENGMTPTTGAAMRLGDTDPRRRRSTSLDSPTESDRLMTRTLREINRQMDAAFTGSGSDAVHDAFSRHQRLVASDLDLSSSPEMKGLPPPFTVGTARGESRRKQENDQASSESLGQLPLSDQTITPTQPSPDGSKLFTEKVQVQRPNIDVTFHKTSKSSSSLSSSRKSKSYSDTESDSDLDDSFTYVTGAASSTSIGDVNLLSPSSNVGGNVAFSRSASGTLACPSDISPTLTNVTPEFSPDYLQQQQQHSAQQMHQHRFSFSSAPGESDRMTQTRGGVRESRSEGVDVNRLSEAVGGREKQTHHQKDDHIIVESPHVIRPSAQRQGKTSVGERPVSESTGHHHHHHQARQTHQDTKGRSDIANIRKNKLSSSSSSSSVSSSSEEFDEVASPEEDEEGEKETPKRNLNLPLRDVADSGRNQGGESGRSQVIDRRNMGQLNVNLPPNDVAPYQVIRRQHSPRVDQGSPRSPMGAHRSPRFDQNFSGAVGGQEAVEPDDGQWKTSPLFSDGNQMDDERMSSLCAVGLMSQRARLSRESSNSSLQSPDSSYANILTGSTRSPLTTPVREALPDLIQSTTQTRGGHSEDDSGTSNAPLQLALYHPDEFSMDIPASVSGHAPRRQAIPPSPSLPQVHSSADTVLMKKPTLKKSSTDNSIRSSTDSSVHRVTSENDHRILSGNLRYEGSLSMDHTAQAAGHGEDSTVVSGDFRHRASSDSRTLRQAQAGFYQTDGQTQAFQDRRGARPGDRILRRDIDDRRGDIGSGMRSPPQRLMKRLASEQKMVHDREDQVAMEIDNLCNKLVDDLNSPQQAEPPTSFPASDSPSYTVTASRDIRTDVDEQGAMSMEVETSLEVKGSEPSSPLVRERRIVRSSSADGENVETRMVSVQNTGGEMEEEEVQNVLNQGREILMSPSSSHKEKSSGIRSSGASGDSIVPVRKSSLSKIPRPKHGGDLVSPRSSFGAGSSSRRVESSHSSSMSSSMYTDTSPSSSSSSSSAASTSSRSRHARRGSETTGVTSAKRQGHIRRSSDTKLTDFRTVSPTSRTQPSSTNRPDSSRTVTSPPGRGSDAKIGSTDNKSSRIPLSHRVPSPQQSDRGAEGGNLGVSKPHSKIPSPIPKPRKTSIGARGDHVVPPTDDIIEVTRQSVKRESSGRAGKDPPARKESDVSGKKTVVVKDMPDKAGAKLVIESQPELKKKIQTVHAKKVSQPPRQVAEAIETDSAGDHRTGCSSSARGSGEGCEFASSTVTFSESVDSQSQFQKETRRDVGEKKTPPPVAKRKFHYDSRSLPRRSKFLDGQVTFPHQTSSCDQYSDMVGSRSSLDDSVLQLAAERHDLFIPEGAGPEGSYGHCTGSLRAKRSQKMQSLMDLFERGSDSNISDSSGSSPGTRHRDRTFSGSMLGQGGQLTPCMERGDLDTTDDDAFLPSASTGPTQQRSADSRNRSQSKERFPSRAGTGGDNGGTTGTANKENVGDRGRSNTAQRKSNPVSSTSSAVKQSARRPSRDRSTESDDLRCRPASPARRARATDRLNNQTPQTSPALSSGSDLSPASKNSRPPRYRSNSKTRTQSESSTSESDTTHQAEGSTVRFASRHISASMSSSYTAHTGTDLFAQPYPDSVLRDSNQVLSALRRQQSDSKAVDTSSSMSVSAGRLSDRSESARTRSGSQTSAGAAGGGSLSSNSYTPPPSPRKNSERRNSIKELLQVFERSETDSVTTDPDPSTPEQVRPAVRSRVRSTSPLGDTSSERRQERMNMRLSLELPPTSSMASQGSQAEVKSQPLRLGPKPFYGSQK